MAERIPFNAPGSTLHLDSAFSVKLLAIILLLMPNDAIAGYAGEATMYVSEILILVPSIILLIYAYLLEGSDVFGYVYQRQPLLFIYFGWCCFVAICAYAISDNVEMFGKIKNLFSAMMIATLILYYGRSQYILNIFSLFLNVFGVSFPECGCKYRTSFSISKL